MSRKRKTEFGIGKMAVPHPVAHAPVRARVTSAHPSAQIASAIATPVRAVRTTQSSYAPAPAKPAQPPPDLFESILHPKGVIHSLGKSRGVIPSLGKVATKPELVGAAAVLPAAKAASALVSAADGTPSRSRIAPPDVKPSATQDSGGSSGGGGSGGGGAPAATYEETPDPSQDRHAAPEAWTPPAASTAPSPDVAAAAEEASAALSPMSPLQASALTAASVPAKKSLWARLIEWLFGSKTPTNTATMGSELNEAAASLVKRARAGDQNAMAILDMVRRNVNTSPKARASYALIHRYIAAHPMPGTEGVLSKMGHDGGKHHRSETRAEKAAKLVALRRPGSRIRDYDARIGAELGE